MAYPNRPDVARFRQAELTFPEAGARVGAQVKVILANPFFPPYAPGGAEFSMAALAEGLARCGLHVTVVTPTYGPRPATPPNVALTTFDAPFRSPPGQDFPIGDWLDSDGFTHLMRKALEECWVPGTLIHLQSTAVVTAGLAVRARGIGPMLLTLRDTATLCPSGWCMMSAREQFARCCDTRAQQVRCAWGFSSRQMNRLGLLHRVCQQPGHWRRWRQARTLRAQVNQLDHLIAVSKGFRSLLLRNGVGHPDRFSTVYNLPPVNWPRASDDEVQARREQLHLARGAQVILVAGKRSLGKGTPWLEEAMELIRHQAPEAVLLSVGKGPSLRAAPWTRTISPVSQADLRVFYALASVVVIPSVWPEPFSRVMLESLVVGRLVVATSVGGSTEGVLPGKTGWLVRPRDAKALAAALLEALRLPGAQRAAMERAASRFLEERFAPKESLEALIGVYNTCCEQWTQSIPACTSTT